MDRKTAFLITAAVAVLFAAALVMMPHPSDFRSDETVVENLGDSYSIEYVTNGGEIVGDAPERYLEGAYTDLPKCVRDGMFFEGWYTDPELTQPIGAVTSAMAGDLVLYASWSDFTLVGQGIEMELDGVYYNGDIEHRVTGTVSWRYMTAVGGEMYVETHDVLTYTSENGFHSEQDTVSGYWTDGSDYSGLMYKGNGTVDGRVCEIWVSDSGETHWIYRGMYSLKIETADGSDRLVFTVSDEYTFVPDLLFDFDVKAELPLDVEMPEEVRIGDRLVMTAVGDGFSGWYADGVLVGTDRRLVVDRADPLTGYEARASEGYAVIQPGDLDLESLGFSGIVGIYGFDGEHVADAEGTVRLEPGFHYLSGGGGNVFRYTMLFVESEKTVYFEWEYGGKGYEYDLRMLYSEVFRSTFEDPMWDNRVVYNDSFVRFLDYDDPYVKELADMLSSHRGDMGEREFAEFVLSFVQLVPYFSDYDTRGATEFIKYPSETLWDGGGDCEDSSILYATLMSVLGYDSAVVIFIDHAMAGVAIEDLRPGDDTFVYGDRIYGFSETTGDDIGYWSTWGKYTPSNIQQFYTSPSYNG